MNCFDLFSIIIKKRKKRGEKLKGIGSAFSNIQNAVRSRNYFLWAFGKDVVSVLALLAIYDKCFILSTVHQTGAPGGQHILCGNPVT